MLDLRTEPYPTPDNRQVTHYFPHTAQKAPNGWESVIHVTRGRNGEHFLGDMAITDGDIQNLSRTGAIVPLRSPVIIHEDQKLFIAPGTKNLWVASSTGPQDDPGAIRIQRGSKGKPASDLSLT